MVVAHSYGGIVVAEAAAGVATVRHLVLVSSYLPEPGESLSTFGANTSPPFLDFEPSGGTFGVRPESLAGTFLQDCPPDIARDAAAHVARQTVTVTQQPVQAPTWHDLPTTYVVCTEDRGTPAAAQRAFSRRADKVIEVKAGHHPFLSQPANRGRHHRKPVMTQTADLVRRLYPAYNSRDVERLLALLTDDVDWPVTSACESMSFPPTLCGRRETHRGQVVLGSGTVPSAHRRTRLADPGATSAASIENGCPEASGTGIAGSPGFPEIGVAWSPAGWRLRPILAISGPPWGT